jgi:hypothetical protein
MHDLNLVLNIGDHFIKSTFRVKRGQSEFTKKFYGHDFNTLLFGLNIFVKSA